MWTLTVNFQEQLDKMDNDLSVKLPFRNRRCEISVIIAKIPNSIVIRNLYFL